MAELRAACFGRDLEHDGWPTVSVVMPIRNEAAHLESAVASVLAQEYPRPFDICLAVAPSDDDTEAVAAALTDREPRIHQVANPAGATPTGLNAAIEASDGEVVVRVDGHANLSTGYIRRAVETMVRTGAVNVGGMQMPEPHTQFEAAATAAATSWLGTGGAEYRIGGDPGPVDTVYLGVFDRAAAEGVGWFSEDLIRNQDYELNIRLRKAGGTVWFDPELRVGYRPRGNWKALAKQYYEYGYWKAVVLRRHPASMRFRQFVPAAASAALGISVLGSARSTKWMLAPAAYAGVVALSTYRANDPLRTGVNLATMHLCWGAGFWSGLTRR